MLLRSDRDIVAPDYTTGSAAGFRWTAGEVVEVPDEVGRHLVGIDGFHEVSDRSEGETPAGHVTPTSWRGVTAPPTVAPAPEDSRVLVTEPALVTDPSEIQGSVEIEPASPLLAKLLAETEPEPADDGEGEPEGEPDDDGEGEPEGKPAGSGKR